MQWGADFRDWLERAKPGSKITYHTGHLCRDRANKDNTWLDTIALTAWNAASAGQVHLVQRRIGNVFDYIAVKR